MVDKIRENFEEWYFGTGAPSHAKDRSGDGYKYMAADSAWRSYKAGALSMTAAGEVLP